VGDFKGAKGRKIEKIERENEVQFFFVPDLFTYFNQVEIFRPQMSN